MVFPVTGTAPDGREVATIDVSASSVGYAFLKKRFEQAVLAEKKATLGRIEDAGVILEFGSGFGLLPKLLFSSGDGFAGTYLMWDLPVFSAIQAFYLRSAGFEVARTAQELFTSSSDRRILCTSVVGEVFEAARALTAKTPAAPRLFVAQWSLSEAPAARRKEVEAVLEAFRFDHFFVVYQQTFTDVAVGTLNNTAYFQSWRRQLPHVRFHEHALKRPVDILLVGQPDPDYEPPNVQQQGGETNHAPSPVAQLRDEKDVHAVTIEVDIDDVVESLTVREDESIKDAVHAFMRRHALLADGEDNNPDADATALQLRQALHLAFADDIMMAPS